MINTVRKLSVNTGVGSNAPSLNVSPKAASSGLSIGLSMAICRMGVLNA